ncbi:hypothetical protein FRC96_11515 [Lujinxingia vulgaris]|uniref:Uncharacterized protein n=1 Tax=Lujinxingia vulgaris TaxID=2600176 RepID=A0A5C6XD29_9DELT|nr:hypothetical protein [Lujinxingia vulgaris]TXD35296.1 hypothetical protein FRC96_11515 [Lujinxingia vulgaris]
MNRCAFVWMTVLLVLTCLPGCAPTSFMGSAYVEGGAAACENKCSLQGLEFAGMVYLGEYTDGCICARPGYEAQAREAAGSVASGAVGVIMQMRRAQEQNQQAAQRAVLF